MSQFIHLTAPTKSTVSVRKEHIISVCSEYYNTMPATFLRLGYGTGQYVLEHRDWILQALEHPDKPNNNERWCKQPEPKTSPTQEIKGAAKSPPKTPNSTPKAVITKPAPKSKPVKKGPPKRK